MRGLSPAHDGELRLARLARQHLTPGQARELRDAERAVVSHLQQKAIAARLGGAEQEVRVDLGQEPLRALAIHLPHLDQRRRVEATEANLVREVQQRLHRGDARVEGRAAMGVHPKWPQGS